MKGFTASFLNLKGNSRPLYWFFALLMSACGVLMMWLPFSHAFEMLVIASGVALASFLAFGVAGVSMWYRGYVYARYFTLA